MVETRPPPPTSRTMARRKTVRRLLLFAGPVVVALGALLLWLGGGRVVSTDNAYLQADNVTVSSRLAGIVAEVLVKDNQRVKAGDVLFRLDREPYAIALASAQAQLAQTEVELAALQATYRERVADLRQAGSDVEFFQRQFERQSSLAGRGVAAEAALDAARRDAVGARAHLTSLRQEAESVLAQLGGDAERPVQKHPRWLAARAAVDRAQYDLGQTEIRAPIDGIVANVDQLQPGEVVAAGTAAFSLLGVRPWVEANPKETELTYVKPGDSATIRVDTYPGREWRGRVTSISPATGAQFAVLPPQNASGNWVKVVQRVPVRLEVDIPEDSPPLSAGMSVEVSIDTGHRRRLGDLWRGLFG
ncbi:MAG: HlyD family secretion protein [Magnetospirillum sp.]|nr:HlyD family secretion protein [Magnetospirillum sp.]